MDGGISSEERVGGCHGGTRSCSRSGSRAEQTGKAPTERTSPRPSQSASVTAYTGEPSPRSSWQEPDLPPGAERAQSRGKRLLGQIKTWVTLSDPSTKDWKTHRKELFSERGISYDDPQRYAKLGAPTGKVPREAARSRSAKSPENRSKEETPFRRSFSLEPPQTAQTSSGSSGRPTNPIAPWED
jgi:hypothetical protein